MKNFLRVKASPHTVRSSFSASLTFGLTSALLASGLLVLSSSQDKVAITLDKTSTGCSLSSSKVTFTGQGTCVVDFNDPGNTTYAAAAQVSQSIRVYSANVITPSKSPTAGSTGGSYSPGAVATSGDTVVKTLASNSTGCSLASGTVTFTGQGTCRVNFTDAGNGAFAAADRVFVSEARRDLHEQRRVPSGLQRRR